MDAPFEGTTEYRSSYIWRDKPPEAETDKYEGIVEKMMQGQYQQPQPKSITIAVDPYELIVQKKMKETKEKNESFEKEALQCQKLDQLLQKSPQESELPSTQVSTPNQTTKMETSIYSDSRPVSRSSKRNSAHVSNRNSRASSRSSIRSRTEDDNASLNSAGDYSSKPANKKKKPSKIVVNKNYDASHLNSIPHRSEADEDYHGNIRPVFLRNPEHASEAEKKHLYGPFYVSWPKNRAMPTKYAELQKVYHKTHY